MQWKSCDGAYSQSHQWNPDGPESDRRGISQQTDAGGVERLEAQTRQHGGCDRYGRSESRRPFDKRAKRERDEQSLDALIAGERADRVLDDLELSGFHRHAIQHDGPEDNPPDWKQPEPGAEQD